MKKRIKEKKDANLLKSRLINFTPTIYPKQLKLFFCPISAALIVQPILESAAPLAFAKSYNNGEKELFLNELVGIACGFNNTIPVFLIANEVKEKVLKLI